jgi:hypothetical protein
MPNYCSNKLVISGKPEHIAEFAKTLENGVFKLSQTLPIPEPLMGMCIGGCIINGERTSQWREVDGENVAMTEAEMDALRAEYGAANWYDWSVNNWGTKWDAEADAEVDSGEIYGWFDTAWAPPIEWAVNVSKKYPELTFEIHYSEGGMGFYGTAVVTKGVLIEDYHEDDFWRDVEELNDDDPYDDLTPACREHIETHGLGFGG